ncbi:FadR/GntR family transcriptional regulator [Conexibacter sp. CPCC 206217]|uniref:FadR/GntR family transcriptional regulator n=1 Tax=Conexibacter sp. CPCC 206217 TaxID=3064574 RepID=UPI00272239E4|nr:FadR/GntR family transcriptional regulator [Conexibacter sp. CPCC 206217]MDO8210209.1 FadR/GntR family transcriptional regulator [Conexibacter sp. CPCC 206217]
MSRAGLQPIPRSPLYEQVAERLRDFIDAERLQPGDRLMSERELAEQLGVSRTSVRQALTALRVQGLVEIKHGEGVFLLRPPGDLIPSLASEIVDSEVDHPMIWEVREAIEVQAARLAARRRSDADLRSMDDALAEMARSIAAGEDGIEGDRHFHRALSDAAHNALLAQLTRQLMDVIDRTSAASLTLAGRPQISLDSHRAILAAIERQDEAAAAEEMRQHVMTSGQRVVDAAGRGSA